MHKGLRTALLGMVAVLTITSCQSGTAGRTSGGPGAGGSAGASGASSGGGSQPARSATTDPSTSAGPGATPTAAVVGFSIPADASDVRPDTSVQVTVTGGRLTTVSLTSTTGKALVGELRDDAAGWHNTDPLAAATSYAVTANAIGGDGVAVTRTLSFTTLRASRIIPATIVPGDDWEVGVGMPVIVTFGATVKNRDAAEAALTVTSTPAVEGAWHWMTNSEVQWRPKEYWPSGTKVNVKVATSGVELAPGAWGKRTVTSQFEIGRAQLSTVDVSAHTLTVQRDGKVIKTIPVTTGKSGFLTRGGTKVIMEKLADVRMDAATTGTDPKDPNYYNILVHWALRLTYSGEFLHAAPWSVWAQGRQNVSHGCTGMSVANARWMFDNSEIGDVVVYTGSSRPLEWGNGYTVWNKSFADWAAAAA